MRRHRDSAPSPRQSEPLVTVIVPAWNAELTLAETLDSVANQTYRNLEIQIVDDGSDDSTAAIAREFCAREPRARLIRHESNRGLAASRNRAISEASGEWIAPIDADDLWHPTRIEKMLEAARTAPEVPGFVYCWHRLIDEKSRVIGSGENWALSGPAFRQLAYYNVVGNGSALLILLKALRAAGGYKESLRDGCEDMMLQLDIARRYPIAVVPENLVGWRQHGRNMSADLERMDRASRQVYRVLRTGRAPVPAYVLRWAEARSAFDLAMRRAWRRQAWGSLTALARTLRLDPVRSSLSVGYAIARSVGSRLRPPSPTGNSPHFYDIDATAPGPGDPRALDVFTRVLRALDRKRMLRLARLKQQF